MGKNSEDPIVIVGMGCRFPGADTPEAFWELLSGGKSMIQEVPDDRWSKDQIYDPDIKKPGKSVTKWGSFIKNVNLFDNNFFATPEDEAERVDPQQRLMLEVVWEALENSCIDPHSLSDTYTGVYIGVSHSDYERIAYRQLEGVVGHDGPGLYHALTANRVSYFLNLKGPSMVVDTACSSSLSALHTAIRSIQFGDIDLAIVGGITLNLTPEETVGLTKASLLSPRGLCSTFSEDADGYVRGEGAAAIIICKQSVATKQNYTSLCKISGSWMNQDGRSNGVLAPSGLAQKELILKTLEQAGLRPEDISYIEAHGTGTYIGDLIEYKALEAVYGAGRQNEKCPVGSVKTNIGHLESASGMASLIKVILSLKYNAIPPHLNLTSLHKNINPNTSNLRIPVSLEKWKAGEKPRRAAISAFGFGGTNCHVIIEEPNPQDFLTKEKDFNLILLSAHTRQALCDKLEQYHKWIISNPAVSPTALCLNVNFGKPLFEERAAIVYSSINELQIKLDSLIQEDLVSKKLSRKKLGWDLSMTQSLNLQEWEKLKTELVFSEAIQDIIDSFIVQDQNFSLGEQWDSIHESWRRFIPAYVWYKSLQNLGIKPAIYRGSPDSLLLAFCLSGEIELKSIFKVNPLLRDDVNFVSTALRLDTVHSKSIVSDVRDWAGLINDHRLTCIYTHNKITVNTARIIEDNNSHCIFEGMLHILKEFLEMGWDINWKCIYGIPDFKVLPLPNYPYQKKSFWIKPVVEKTDIPKYPSYSPSKYF